MRGTLKVAELVGDAKAPGIISMSLYDTKPVYLMIVSCEEIKWIKKDCKLFDKTQQKMVSAPFHRVNIIDDYNHFIGNVDIADQLRGFYRFDHWMKRKWWWNMFFWAFQVLLTNSYILYKDYYLIRNLKPMSQYKFRYQITLA